ncbi:hypothetical protein TNIN_463641 [Trichonephila inaurata madagascariensis]|uniref:Uncharacterized protein n=1 Tax=Trichonephila inaurata madagascariensis TaxID=2747483 RepID=A0A8X6YSZ2_9ARAC|nr:hypothetical protein TNIN_463641 [Trichonephila inaurata madagascariensis]
MVVSLFPLLFIGLFVFGKGGHNASISILCSYVPIDFIQLHFGCNTWQKCRSYHEFPPDLFTHTQRARGAVIIHIAVIIYMFYAVAVVCDDYFVASLEECCSVYDPLTFAKRTNCWYGYPYHLEILFLEESHFKPNVRFSVSLKETLFPDYHCYVSLASHFDNKGEF